jgi:large subunit ribosomal protein L21
MAYAIIKTGGKQYKVAEGDLIEVEKLAAEVGDTVTFDEVLLVGGGDDEPQIGSPFLEGAKVTAEVTDQFRAKKVTAYKFKRRKGHQKTKGHRRQMTRLTIKSI